MKNEKIPNNLFVKNGNAYKILSYLRNNNGVATRQGINHAVLPYSKYVDRKAELSALKRLIETGIVVRIDRVYGITELGRDVMYWLDKITDSMEEKQCRF